jgi:predicted ATPase
MAVNPPTLKEVLDSYSHIDLTDDEYTQALIDAKRKKVDAIRVEEYRKFQEANRRLRQMTWDFDVIKTFMVNRAEKIFNGKFILDENNEELFDLLCYYFISDEVNFIKLATKLGVANPTIKKGILIPGKFGCGKTWLMKLFSRNARQSFEIIRAKDISQEFLMEKNKQIPAHYTRLFRNNAAEDTDLSYPNEEVFNQMNLGMCIDDLGSEDKKNNFGNVVNVIGDILEARYAEGFTGIFLHGTTNLNAEQLKEFYGGRVASRMREIFNFIELPGTDRRK